MIVTINENDCGCATCGNIGNSDICAECSWDSRWEPKPLTNGDSIRAMTDEELASFFRFSSICSHIQENDYAWCETYGACSDCVIGWLKQPAKEDT